MIRLLPIILLAGCAAPKTEFVEIEVPVIVPCEVTVPMPPRYEANTLQASDTAFEKIRALLVERQQRIHTEEELRALIAACQEP